MVTGPTILKIATVVTILLFAVPIAAEAQQAGKIWRIGLLFPGLPPGCGSDSRPPVLLALREGLRELGHVETQNYVFVPRCAMRRKRRC
jgi:hypothetical protein